MRYERRAKEAIVEMIQRGASFAEVREKLPISQRSFSRWKCQYQPNARFGRPRILSEVAIQHLLQTLLSSEHDLEKGVPVLNWQGVRERSPERSYSQQSVIRLLKRLGIHPACLQKRQLPNRLRENGSKKIAMMRKVHFLELCEWKLPSAFSLPAAMSTDSRKWFLWRFWGRRGEFYFAFSQRIPSNAAKCLATALKPIKATALIVADDLLEKLLIKDGISQPPIPIIKIPVDQIS